MVDYSPQQEGKVFFGAWVEVENDDGEVKRFRIVGPDEIYQRKEVISIDAPMARALLKRSVDEDVVVQTPSGAKTWYINLIAYQQPAGWPLPEPRSRWQRDDEQSTD